VIPVAPAILPLIPEAKVSLNFPYTQRFDTPFPSTGQTAADVISPAIHCCVPRKKILNKLGSREPYFFLLAALVKTVT